MITLYQFTTIPEKPDISPFTTKVEMFLKYYKIPYIIKRGNAARMPKKKLPCIQDGDKLFCDSEHIINYFKSIHKVNPDCHLSKYELAQSLAFKKMAEEYLYFILLFSRWIDESGWKFMNEKVFGHLPFMVKKFLPKQLRRQVAKSLYVQGIGRHAPVEIYAFGRECLENLSIYLNDKTYFMGEKISSLDFSLFPLLWNIGMTGIRTPLTDLMLSYPNLIDYCKRVGPEFNYKI